MAETRVFSWARTNKELVKYLLTMKERQSELVDQLVQAGVTGLERKDANGRTIQLSTMDPFTFFFGIYKYADRRCLDILQTLSESIGITAPIDVFGTPHTDPRIVWDYLHSEDGNDPRIQTIWDFFEKAVTHKLTDDDFEAILKIVGIEKPKLSQGLFLTDPDYYLNLDTKTRKYLKANYALNVSFSNYTEYMDVLSRIKELTGKTFIEISYEAIQKNNGQDSAIPNARQVQVPAPKKDNLKPDPRLNQILFGPPGTGKTYNSISLAVEIADPLIISKIEDKEAQREQIRDRYMDLVKEGRIVFTTFHQSMCYEDFIEGIKPVTNEDNSIGYDVLPGLFKKLCTIATYSAYAKLFNKGITRVKWFDLAYDRLLETIEQALVNNIPYQVKSKEKYPINVVGISDYRNLIVKHINNETDTKHTVSHQRLLKLFMAYESKDKITRVSDIRGVIGGANCSAYWAILNELFEISNAIDVNTNPRLNIQDLDYESMATAIASFNWRELDHEKIASLAPYVLIIDEINRGNVSQIFGELITLIEKDKRAGMKEALEVTLPYSKEKFSVPPNLYIIGTMNTADRSVEARDTALRRRFTFKEYLPQYEIKLEGRDLMADELCGYKLSDILRTINKRIRMLLDRDHQIGHSYFMGLKSDEALMEVFNQKIIPLLQEYFFGDYAKIGLVLGKGFVEKEDLKEGLLASFDYDDKDSLVKDSYILLLHKDVEAISAAISLMMNQRNGTETT